jgi:hypothetical protein
MKILAVDLVWLTFIKKDLTILLKKTLKMLLKNLQQKKQEMVTLLFIHIHHNL